MYVDWTQPGLNSFETGRLHVECYPVLLEIIGLRMKCTLEISGIDQFASVQILKTSQVFYHVLQVFYSIATSILVGMIFE